jgi:hypothetical protein
MNKNKRSLVNEIKEVKSRTEFNSRMDYGLKLSDIQYAFEEALKYNGDYEIELIKYIPIATVACFEAFFRSAYKELIDFGLPYSENAIRFNQTRNIKFDFEIINAVQDKSISIGEFISHLLPCNNFDDINSNMSTILNKDFAQCIREFIDNELTKEFYAEIKTSFNEIIPDIKRTFEIRHIFCHEFATNFKIDKSEILRCFHNAKVFLEFTNDYLQSEIYPNAPKTQVAMNEFARQEFFDYEKKLDNLIQNILEANDDYKYVAIDSDSFLEVIEKWKEYREFKARTDSGLYFNGSMYNMIYFSSLSVITKEKIESLTDEFELCLRNSKKST